MPYEEDSNSGGEGQLFLSPGAGYRAAPFWAWNGKLGTAELKKQIDAFSEMGFGGFHMHPRFGLKTPYLKKRFLDRVGECLAYAEEKGMYARLYDEDRWPSGFCGGAVTADPAFRAKNIRLRERATETAIEPADEKEAMRAYAEGREYLLARYDIRTDGAGRLLSYRTLARGEEAERPYYLYVVTEPESDWYNGKAYVDVMNARAIEKFISLTHEKYFERFGERFGKSVPSIFSDEPMFANVETGSVAWTDGMRKAYLEKYGEDIVGSLPELFFSLAEGRYSQFCLRFYDLSAQLFREAYAKQIGDWCGAHGLGFTGHYMEEDSIDGQIRRSGSVMRHYVHYSLPGIDMLCDFREYHTSKQTQSVVRQTGKEGMMCECFGSTGYGFDFRRMKLQGDWLAASGVTLRVPHLSWYTMEGLGKRDYPPVFGYQVPWSERFSVLEDHFARVSAVMTLGDPVVRVAVIHPVESGWLLQKRERDALNEKFLRLNALLLGDQFDFDYIDEQLFAEYCPRGGAPLCVGKARYDAVVVADCLTLRSSTAARLQAFAEAGGKLLFYGEVPALLDAEPSSFFERLSKSCAIARTDRELLDLLSPLREVAIERDGKGAGVDYLYQLRQKGDTQWLFLAHGDAPSKECEKISLYRKGTFSVERMDTLSGETEPLSAVRKGGWTKIEIVLYAQDSLLLKLTEETER